MKAVGYIRVSTQGQADDGVSLEAQRAKLAAYCQLNDGELLEVFADEGSAAPNGTAPAWPLRSPWRRRTAPPWLSTACRA